LGYDRQREEEEEMTRKQAEASLSAARQQAETLALGYKPSNGLGKGLGAAQVNSPGFARLGFGALPGSATAAAVTLTKKVTSKYVKFRNINVIPLTLTRS
jgi:hypothetical protein